MLDVDVCGPSMPRMLGVQSESVRQSSIGWTPVYAEDNLAVMSIAFLLPDPDAAVIWRGPKKNGACLCAGYVWRRLLTVRHDQAVSA